MGQIIYVMCETGCGPSKIGRALDATIRRRTLQSGNPRKLKLWAEWHCPDAIAAERYLHGVFQDRRGLGEWFHVAPFEVGAAISDAIEDESVWRHPVKRKRVSAERRIIPVGKNKPTSPYRKEYLKLKARERRARDRAARTT